MNKTSRSNYLLALLCSTVSVLIMTSVASAQTYEHWLEVPELQNCEAGTQQIRENLVVNGKAGSLLVSHVKFTKHQQLYTGEFTIRRCKDKLATGVKVFAIDGGSESQFAAFTIDASHLYDGDFVRKNNPSIPHPIVTVIDENASAGKGFFASNHPSFPGNKEQIVETSVEDLPNGDRVFRVLIDTTAINNPSYKAGWKGLVLGDEIALWVFPLAKQENGFCTGEAGEPARCAQQRGFYEFTCFISGRYELLGDLTNQLPQCQIKMGSSIVAPGSCVSTPSGGTFTAQIHVIDADAGQTRSVQFVRGDGVLNPGAVRPGGSVNVNSSGFVEYALSIPETNFAQRYSADFLAKDNGFPETENGFGREACGIAVCPTQRDDCPNDPNKISPGICGCGVPDIDTDKDGALDCKELCDTDPNKVEPGKCGCGVADTDSDQDGTPNCLDQCPNDPNKTAPGKCGCGKPDTDTDGDGKADCEETCIRNPHKFEPGICGCDVADTDTDGDGKADCQETCDTDPNKFEPGVCGCGVPDIDKDGDGKPDCNDLCPQDPNKSAPGVCGCGVADTDTDGDGTADCMEECDTDPNKTVPGKCGCGVADTDTDGDGVPDCIDLCDHDPNKAVPGVCGCGVSDADTDGDGVPDCQDECKSDPNKTKPGTCGCNVADSDTDGDGVADCNENCDADPNKTEPGACGCGVPDDDKDGDGKPDCDDLCPSDPDKTAPGVCGCNVPDIDSDKDGVLDCDDACSTDGNKTEPGICGCGIPDTDSDGDGTPDCKEVDDPCNEVNPPLPDLDVNAAVQKSYVDLALRMLGHHAPGQRRFIAATRQAANGLYLESWALIWSVPQKILICPASNTLCVEVYQIETKQKYGRNSEDMHKLLTATVKRLRKVRKDKSRGSRLMQRSREALVRTQALLAQLPDQRHECPANRAGKRR